MTMPPIFTYGPNPFAPAHMRWAAAMQTDGRPGTSWLCTAATEDAARAKLEAIWVKQFPPTDKRKGPRVKPATESDALADDGDVDCGIVI